MSAFGTLMTAPPEMSVTIPPSANCFEFWSWSGPTTCARRALQRRSVADTVDQWGIGVDRLVARLLRP